MESNSGIYLTFTLGKEFYGIPVLKIKDIIGMIEITEVPRTPEFIKGVINLRGKIIPIMDLRLKFGLEEKEYNERTVIIVLEIQVNEEKRLMAVVVDTVAEVVNIQEGSIEPPPQYGTSVDTDFIMGMAKVKEKVVMLLNIEKVLNAQELAALAQIKGE
ncbi:MAG TPA: chemotaxis protein CheW [Thermotogota bacterium]|nr:chemotaxis protein CheW [Thermotogota bacterium]HRW91461.1 chemotaxis protein CheW [Thermotogota bacterium]